MGDIMEEELKIMDKFFRFREEKFMEEITLDMESIEKLENNKINVNKRKINELVNQIPEENKLLKEEILNRVDDLIADYNVAIACNNKKFYKQGFQDAMILGTDPKITN